MHNGFVCLMGIGTVFIGLICIVLICNIMSTVMRVFSKKDAKSAPAASVVASAPVNVPIQDKQAIIAGTCVVIAEELGTDVSNIRVLSFKRI